MFCGGGWFLQGGFAFLWCFVMVNRGEVVVNCVVNRGVWRTLFCRLKIFIFLKYFFGQPEFRDDSGDLQRPRLWLGGVEKQISPLRCSR
jgi:hypothetical protein